MNSNSAPTGILALERLFPVRIFQIAFEFTQKTSFPFLHQPVVNGFLRNLANAPGEYSDLPVHTEWTIHTPENGRIEYNIGDHYYCYIFVYPDISVSIRTMFGNLKKLPQSAEQQGCSRQMADNLRLLFIKDAISNTSITEPEHAKPLTVEKLNTWAHELLIQNRHSVPIFLGPARLLVNQPTHKKEKKLCSLKSEFTVALFFQRLYDSLNNLIADIAGERCHRKDYWESRPYLDNSSDPIDDVFWVDSFYQNQEGSAKEIGGMYARFTLNTTEYDFFDYQLLLAAEIFGFGQKRNFGYGRFTRQLSQLPTLKRAQSLLDYLFSTTERLETAKQIFQKSKQAYIDVENIRSSILNRNYTPSALYPKLLENEKKPPRLLLLPNSRDKLTQKVISQFLYASLDTLYSKASFGYRKGLSRMNAALRIQYLYRKGFKFAFDADITDFFGAININIVLHRLIMLYGYDQLWLLLESFLFAPLQQEKLPEGFEGYEPRGLTLGSSLSPALANLVLDYFDVFVAHQNLSLVRYADDFLILTRTQQDAELAQTKAESFLNEQGFELNPQKTSIRSFSDGVYFLGYLFINDLVVNASNRLMNDIPPVENDTLPDAINAHEDVAEYKAYHIDQSQCVCITGEISTIYLKKGQLCIYCKDQLTREIPINHLNLLILFGKHNLSTPALTALIEKGVQVHFASRFGRYIGCASRIEPNPELHLRQANQFANPALALSFFKKIVQARIRSQREVLRARKLDHSLLNDHLAQVERATSTESLLGTEANAAKNYWAEVRQHLDSSWGFTHRDKPNSSDPFNSLLNMGYSLLFSYVDTIVRASGLYPSLGGYHKSRRYSALAADLMEPFRYIIERKALTMIAKKQIKYEDFYWQDDSCLLNSALRASWIFALVDELQTIKYTEEDDKFSLLEAIHRQNQQLVSWLYGDSKRFEAWIAR